MHTQLPRVTYSNIDEDFSGVHAAFEAAIADARKRLGGNYANYVDGADDSEGELYEAWSPIDRSFRLGTFVAASDAMVARAVEAASKAFEGWARTGWMSRLQAARRAADILERDKFAVAAACLIEVGKSRMEAMGEMEEPLDIIRFYADEMEQNNGFERPLKRAHQRESTMDVLRPYGVFAVIAPFNFPVALSIGMSICALIAGNTVVFKPSSRAGLTGRLITDCFHESGFPAGVFNLLNGGATTGNAIAGHPGVDGIAFTGSNAVGMNLLRTFGAGGPCAKPVLAELGGKNPTYVCASADRGVAVAGMTRSAFGLQGQKCSAGSVVFVHEAVASDYVADLVSATAAIKVGDPSEKDVFMGPLIDRKAFDRFLEAVEEARKAGAFVHGGKPLTEGIFANGYYVEPAIVTGLPDDHWLHREELFMPFLTVRSFSDLSEAITRGNAVQYGLTAGIYTRDDAELQAFVDSAEAGALYANRPSGATTGAWPGVQTFCGWKGSGTGSKGGLGSWYLPQFMREQSRTIMLADA